MAKILLVEDHETYAETVADGLQAHRFIVEIAATGQEAIERITVVGYDLIIVDWELPDISGLLVVKKVREHRIAVPIIMLTGKASVEEKTEGINAGADDYITKPFDFGEFVARINAALRRSAGGVSHILKVSDLELDPVKYQISRGGQSVHVSPMDFALLEFLMRHPGQVFSAQALMSRVWHMDSDASTEGVRTAVRRIRKAIEKEGEEESILENVARVGYRIIEPRSS
jgi:DNA-binding response OmpR family regulator